MSPNPLIVMLSRSILWGALIALMLGFHMPPGDRHRPRPSPPTVWHTRTMRGDVRVPAVAPSPDADARGDRALAWAERLLAKVPVLPSRNASCSEVDAESAFAGILERYGLSARACLGLARCQLRLGEYEEADASFSQALRLAPEDRVAEKEWRAASEVLNIFQTCNEVYSETLPDDQSVLRVGRLGDFAGARWWVVLLVKAAPEADSENPYADPQLKLIQEVAGHDLSAWQGPVKLHPVPNKREFRNADLFIADMTGDGEPEVAVCSYFMGASWRPANLDVFQRRGNRLVNVLSVASGEPAFWFEDLNHDGRLEIANPHQIGRDMSHAGQPWWTDLYAWKNGAFRLANADFPDEFRDADRLLRPLLRRYSGDFDLLKYLGVTHEIFHRSGAALAAYRQAVRRGDHPGDRDAGDPEDRRSLAELKQRIGRLQRRIGRAQRPRQLLPVDEGPWDRSFVRFREQLLDAARRRDKAFLLSVLAPNVESLYDGRVADNPAEFQSLWRLDRPDSELWATLSDILSHGGAFELSEDDHDFCAPYVAAAFPFERLDPAWNGGIIDRNVKLRSRPRADAPVIATLDYAIVQAPTWEPILEHTRDGERIWRKIITARGQQGYVADEFLRSPNYYEASFQKVNGQWKMYRLYDQPE
jgi:tetratricopeptide (TPR) repeat protein